MAELHLEPSRSEPFTKGRAVPMPAGSGQLHTRMKQAGPERVRV